MVIVNFNVIALNNFIHFANKPMTLSNSVVIVIFVEISMTMNKFVIDLIIDFVIVNMTINT